MSRLKDDIIEDTSKLGDVIELCNKEIKLFTETLSEYIRDNKYMEFDEDNGELTGRYQLANNIMTLINK